MLNGTTYIVRPCIDPRKRLWRRSRISAGAIQWLVGPASPSRSEQMKVRSSTRATSLGSVLAQYDPGRRASVDEAAAELLVLGVGAVAPADRVGLAEPGHRLNPSEQPLMLGRGVDHE